MIVSPLQRAGAAAAAVLALVVVAAAVRGPDSAASPGAGASAGAPAATPTPSRALRIDRVSPRPETYGVGITVRITFNRDVPTRARTAVTDRIHVTSTKPLGDVGWAWTDARTAVFRPREFWPAHSTVTIRADASGETLTQIRGRDLRWEGRADSTFDTGAAQIITINAHTDQATVVRDGTTVRTIPVSLGMPGWETRSGVKVLMEKYATKTMTSESIGAPDPYVLEVRDAIRLTASGEFIHAAPWATGRLGRSNGSHGCTNVSDQDAHWLYQHHLYGDPVITTGTSREMEPDNGAGGVWNVPWATWQTGVA